MNIKEKIKVCVKYIILFAMSLTKFIPIQEKRFFFSNYFGKSGFGDNLKYIAEELHNKEPASEIFWAVDKNQNGGFPSYVKVVKNGSIQWFWAAITSKYWIDNERKHLYMYKKPTQFYLQTWHGGISLKYIEMDAIDSYPEKVSYLAERRHDNKIVNAYISNSKFCTNMYRTAFKYKGEIWEEGYPRNDILIKGNNEEIRKKVLDQFRICEDSIVIMYAPTYRKSKTIDIYKIDFKKILDSFKNKYKKNVVLLLRLHPNLVMKANKIEYTNSVINASNYPDIQELMVAADALITDYSNVMFEFSYQLKPCFLYAPDFNEYLEDRNLYFDYESLPYPIAYNLVQLTSNINEFRISKYKLDVKKFWENIDVIEPGDAARRIVSRLLK